MLITCDPEKRRLTLENRGLDLLDAAAVFARIHFTREDVRVSYPEPRFITMGLLHDRMVVVVWTPRHQERRIISMRKANGREQARFAHHLEGS